MIVNALAKPLVRALARPLTGYVFSPPVVVTQRVQNGDFSSATGWSGATWTIAAGTATNDTPGSLINTLLSPLANGTAFTMSIDIIANPLVSGIIVRLTNSGGSPAPQQIYMEAVGPGNITTPGVSTGVYDQLTIISADDPGMVIDNVSLLA